MQNNLVPTSNVQDFLNHMRTLEKRDMKAVPRPMNVRIDGNTGFYMTNKWNEEEQKKEKITFGVGQGLTGTILANRSFVQSIYVKGATRFHKTREFVSFSDDEIILLEIDQNAEEKSKEIARFKDYYAFKDAMTSVNEITGASSYNFELHANLYVYVHEMKQVICLEMKSKSLSAWFDYSKTYRKGFSDITTLVQAKTEFRQSEETNTLKLDEKGQPTKYFASTLTTIGKNSDQELVEIMEVTRALFEWMSGWERSSNPVKAESVPIQPAPALSQPATEMDVLAAMGPVDPQLAQDIANLPFNQS